MRYGAFCVICPRASSQYVMPLPNPVDPDPLKYVGGVRVCFDTFFHSKLLLDNSACFTS